jgi:hypothetical protein
MRTPAALGALTSMTTLSVLTGFALAHEGVGTFLSIILALLAWWILGLLYEIRYK